MFAAGALARLGPDGLPVDFHNAPRNYTVYIGKAEGTNVDAYVGITNDLARRKREWKGVYELREVVTDLTKKEARAVEQVIMNRNPHFRNINNAIDRRHRWYRKAIEWAERAVKGRRLRR